MREADQLVVFRGRRYGSVVRATGLPGIATIQVMEYDKQYYGDSPADQVFYARVGGTKTASWLKVLFGLNVWPWRVFDTLAEAVEEAKTYITEIEAIAEVSTTNEEKVPNA